ncbi:MAG: metallophosphoesterase [Kiritimatiellaeota bacterium]|nr:metallophosphoesterase [Kiritimatiellota bacterium]
MERFTRRAALLLLASLALSLRLVAAEGVTIAVTGDIYTPDLKVVSDAILAQKPLDAVLLVGDTCNGKTSPIEKFNEIYSGTYDRFKALIFPCPGNHDSYSKPAFSGYREYWGARAHAPEQYYSFDLGGWHIVSLDSVSFHDSKSGPKQLSWLKADLAANPKKPVIAYWHYPMFSRAKHCGDPKMKPMWEVIEKHGPALIFCGHNHVYERFPALDASGQPTDAAQGVHEFVVGPGGAGPIKSEDKDAKGPASSFFHGGTQHVGFFVLQPDGAYAFTIKSVAKDGQTVVVDQGKGKLQPK